MWTSREGWLAALGEWARSPRFAAAARSARVSMTAATLLGIAAVMAEHADHATGRHVAVTRATIADRVGCSPDTVTVAWRLLRVAGWAVEAQRGHGSPGTPAAGRRPSVYHLVPRREPRPVVHNPVHTIVHNPDLPPKADSDLLPPVGNHSPSAHTRPKQSPLATSAARRRYRAAPRPLPVQRLAAELVASCHGLHRGHIGAVCDALTAAGIDPGVWSARSITTALDADMRVRGWSWPDRIERPGAFLASRLGRLDWRPQGPPKGGGTAAASPDKAGRPHRAGPVPPARVVPTPAHQHPRRHQLDEARTAIGQRRPTATPTPRGAAHAATGHGGAASAAVCVVCKAGQPVPVRRRYRGLLGPHMCDPCWLRVTDQSAPAG